MNSELRALKIGAQVQQVLSLEENTVYIYVCSTELDDKDANSSSRIIIASDDYLLAST